MNADQVYQIGQTIGLIALAIGAAIVTVRQKFFKPKKDDGTDSVKLPPDALSKSHPDPVVRRLERMVEQLGTQLDAQQKRVDAADNREGLLRKEMDGLRREARANGDQVYWLRRIVRRLIDSWPAEHGSPPPLSQHEWEIVGVDEDTTPRSEIDYRTEDTNYG